MNYIISISIVRVGVCLLDGFCLYLSYYSSDFFPLNKHIGLICITLMLRHLEQLRRNKLCYILNNFSNNIKLYSSFLSYFGNVCSISNAKGPLQCLGFNDRLWKSDVFCKLNLKKPDFAIRCCSWSSSVFILCWFFYFIYRASL